MSRLNLSASRLRLKTFDCLRRAGSHQNSQYRFSPRFVVYGLMNATIHLPARSLAYIHHFGISAIESPAEQVGLVHDGYIERLPRLPCPSWRG